MITNANFGGKDDFRTLKGNKTRKAVDYQDRNQCSIFDGSHARTHPTVPVGNLCTYEAVSSHRVATSDSEQ